MKLKTENDSEDFEEISVRRMSYPADRERPSFVVAERSPPESSPSSAGHAQTAVRTSGGSFSPPSRYDGGLELFQKVLA